MSRAFLIFGPGFAMLVPVLSLMYFMHMWSYRKAATAATFAALALVLLFFTLPA